jgi:hypothetical protein
MINSRKSWMFAALLVSAFCSAQTSSTPPVSPVAPHASAASSVLSQQLGQLDQAARQTVLDLGRVRVDKWKTDGNTKDQARANIDSLQKNLTNAVPTLTQQVQANPASVAAALKLYRNLNVVYDVLASVTESAGAFGSKDDYQALASDISNLDQIRRGIADQLEVMAANQDSAYAQLLNQVRLQQQQAAAAATAPPKKVIVDDNEPEKKPKKKKAPPVKSAPAKSAEPTPKSGT